LADAGRFKVESLGGVPVIAEMLNNPKNTKRLRMVLGCIGNLVSGTEHLAVAMQKTLPVLSDCILHPQPDISSMAILALSNMMANEELKILALKADVYRRLLEKMLDHDPSTICNVLTAMNVFCETKPIADRFFNENNGFGVLFNIAKQYENPEVEDEDEREDVEEEAHTIIKATLNVLHELAQIDDEYRALFLSHPESIAQLFAFAKSRNVVFAEESSKVIAYLSLSADINRTKLFEQVPVFLQWIKRGDSAELRLSAAMILGNLAEDESTASKLIDSGAASAMIAELSRGLAELQTTESASMVEAAQNSEKEGKEMRIKHLCASGLKNLAIHPDHKIILLKQGVLSSLIALLQQRNEIVMHAALLLIKSLFLAGTPAISEFLCLDPQARTLLSLTTKDEENKKQDHVFFEASRAIGVLLRQMDSDTLSQFLSNYTPLPDGATGPNGEPVIIDGKKFLSPYTAISNLIFSKFTVLQAEGGAIAALLIDNDPHAALAFARVPELLNQLQALLKHYLLDIKDESLVRPTSAEQPTFPVLSTVTSRLLSSKDAKVKALVHSGEINWPEFYHTVEKDMADSRKPDPAVSGFLSDLRSATQQ
jgi:hypothetical protein